VSIPFLFQGQYYDCETGLAYNRFRYYDPELGRYISEDPIGLAGGIKLYGYVEDSLSWIDPFGLTSTSYAEEARALGYESVNNQRSHGQPIFKKGRSKGEKQKSPKGSPRYITPDKDQHIGGYWKGAERIEDLHSKRTRSGTYDKNLNRIGD
jgi:RHS family protein